MFLLAFCWYSLATAFQCHPPGVEAAGKGDVPERLLKSEGSAGTAWAGLNRLLHRRHSWSRVSQSVS